LANHKSALKRAAQNEMRRTRNRAVRTRVKSAVKAVRQLAANNSEGAQDQLKAAQAVIDKAAKKGVLHKKTASRKVARLAKLARSVQS
jgi:small subunit ribosomal protein S20